MREKHKKGSKLNTKLIGLSVITSFCTIVILGVMVYSFTYLRMRGVESSLLSDLVKQYGIKVDANINELERISFNFLLNDELMSLLKSDIAPTRSNEISRYVGKTLAEFTNFRRDIIGIYVYSLKGNTYSNSLSRSFLSEYSLFEQQWYQDHFSGPRFGLYLHNDQTKFLFPTNDALLSFIKNVYDFNTGNHLGAIEIDIDTSILQSFSMPDTIDVPYDIYVLGEVGDYVFGSRESDSGFETDIPSVIAQIREDGKGENAFTFFDNHESSSISYSKSDYSGLTFFAVRQNNDILVGWRNILLVILLSASMLSLLLAAAIARFTSRKVFLPLKNLQGTMQRISSNNLDARAEIAGSDELEEFARIFNTMVDSLNAQMKINMELQHEKDMLSIQKARCELDALQSQINPHFLYNTLEAISMTARVNNEVEIQKMTIMLGKLMRANIARGNVYATLQEELDHITSYIELHRICFRKGLNLIIDIDEDTRALNVIRFMLQPLVENAIKYGFDQNESAQIAISAATMDGLLQITIEDNGSGMPKRMVKTMNDLLASTQNNAGDKIGIGLTNTNKRIQLYCNSKEYGIKILKSDNTGTRIGISLPVLRSVKEVDDAYAMYC